MVLTKGKESFETSIKLLYEDNGIPLSDRKEQERVTKVLFDMTEGLAYLVYQINTDLAYIDEQLKAAKKPAKLNQLKDKLTQLKETLVVTTGDNYVGRSAKQLREKLSDLYAKIVKVFERPTPAEMLNLKLLQGQYNKAKETYQRIQNKDLKKLLGSDAIAYKSFEEFVK